MNDASEERVPDLPVPRGTRMFQIHKSDLEALEELVPIIVDLAVRPDTLDNALKVKIRRVKQVLSDVRWDYQPWGEVEIIPAE